MFVSAAILCALSMLLVVVGSVRCGALHLGFFGFLLFCALGVVGMWNAHRALGMSAPGFETLSAFCAGACVLVMFAAPLLLTMAMVAGVS